MDKDNFDYQIYELHFTIDTNGRVDEFLKLCDEIFMKPIILDLDGETQFTTAITLTGDLPWFKRRVKALREIFEGVGFAIIREKYETTPWNPYVPYMIKENNKCYYETHFSFLTTPTERERVNHFCKLYGVHMSRNALRHDQEGLTKYMGTVRDDDDGKAHGDRVNMILMYLSNNGIVPQKTVTEFAFYDSNKALDNNWMNKK